MVRRVLGIQHRSSENSTGSRIRGQNRSSRSVAEQDRDLGIIPVGDPGQRVTDRDENRVGGARCDERVRAGNGVQEPGTCRVHGVTRDARVTQPGGDRTGGVRHVLTGRERCRQQQVHFRGFDAGVLQRRLTGGDVHRLGARIRQVRENPPLGDPRQLDRPAIEYCLRGQGGRLLRVEPTQRSTRPLDIECVSHGWDSEHLDVRHDLWRQESPGTGQMDRSKTLTQRHPPK